jgi:hypothetical protein
LIRLIAIATAVYFVVRPPKLSLNALQPIILLSLLKSAVLPLFGVLARYAQPYY